MPKTILLAVKKLLGAQIFWSSPFPSDYVAVQFNVQTPFVSASMRLAMANCMQKAKKGEQETKIQSTKKVQWIVRTPICKRGKLARRVITHLTGGVSPAQ